MKMPAFDQRSPLQREWESLCKKEQSALERRQKKTDSALQQMLAQKIPEKLQDTLDLAFEKAFALIFEKGSGVIEKTYNKEARQKEFQLHRYADELYESRKSLRAFSRQAGRANAVNLALSGVSGVGMGLLGVGIPDIPLFTGMVLKAIYETALSYGFEYDSPQERYFILLLMEGAVSYGERAVQVENELARYMEHPQLPENYDSAAQTARTSRALSKQLLYMKFLQGIPIVGAVGGAYDVVYMKQISEYAVIKYKKRFLLRRQEP